MIRNSLPLITTPKAACVVLQANVKAGFPYRVVAEPCASRCPSVHIIDKGASVSEGSIPSKCGPSERLGEGSISPIGCVDITDFMVSAVQNDLEAIRADGGRMGYLVGTDGGISQRWQSSRPVLIRERISRLAGCPINLRNQTTPFVATSYGYRQFSSVEKSGQDTCGCSDSSEMFEPSSVPDDRTAFKISPDRKAAFMKARKTGVTRRLLEGGGVPRNLDLSTHGHNAPIEIDKTILDAVWEEDGANFSGDEQSLGVHEETYQIQTSRPKGDDYSSLGISEEIHAAEQRREARDAEMQGAVESARDRAPPSDLENRKGSHGKLHPVLGELVADLKYKRVYVTSAEALTKAPVWEKAKTLVPLRTTEIAEAKCLKNKVVEGMPGVITLYKRPLLPLTKEKQAYTLGVVDGQHRLGAMLLMAEKDEWDKTKRNVLIEVFDTKDEDEVARLFAEINRVEPMRVEEMLHEGHEEIKESIVKAVLKLQKMFPDAFGTKRARPPSVHAASFKDNIIKSGMIQRHQLFNSRFLLDHLLRVNDIISRRDAKFWGTMVGKEDDQYPTKKALGNALRRAKRSKFFLGLESSWMQT